MDFEKNIQNEKGRSKANPVQKYFEKENIVVIYTTLAILLKMKNKLGFGAMMEYLEKYVQIVGRYNPKVEEAVNHAMLDLCVDQLYKKLVRGSQGQEK